MMNRRMPKGGFALLNLLFEQPEFIPSKFDIRYSLFDIRFSEFLFRFNWLLFSPTVALIRGGTPDT